MINQVTLIGTYYTDYTSPQGRRPIPVAVDSKGRLMVSVDYGDLASALSAMEAESPSFAGLTVSGLTASRPVFTNASKALVSNQGAAVADAAVTLASAITQLNLLLAQLRTLGVIAT